MTKNEAAAILVEAGLQGHPEQRGAMHYPDGDCALGIVHIALHRGERAAAVQCGKGYWHLGWTLVSDSVYTCPAGGLADCDEPHGLWALIVHLFEHHGFDALTTGRKLESLEPVR